MNKDHAITHLIHVKPAEAKRLILDALRGAKMHKGQAAKALGCGPATFIRWVDALALDEDIAKMKTRAEKEGWHHDMLSRGGRPPSETPKPKKKRAKKTTEKRPTKTTAKRATRTRADVSPG